MTNPLSYLPPNQPTVDDYRSLRLMGIIHCVLGGMSACGAVIPLVSYAELWGDPRIRSVLIIFLALCTAQILSGSFMLSQRSRWFSFTVSAFECLLFPLWTILGVYTLLLLADDRVRRMYRSKLDEPVQKDRKPKTSFRENRNADG